jgi:pSer/pThr/pTyr-binding forkhead associated (FHA) protein
MTGERGAENSGNLRLEAVAGNATGFSFEVEDRLVIGRNSEGPGRLADDPELSRHHAEIVRAPSGEFTIKDLSSTNGTFVNGTRLTVAAVLGVGDEIAVGGTKIAVRFAPVIAPPATADVDVRAATLIGDAPATLRQSAVHADPGSEPQPVAPGAEPQPLAPAAEPQPVAPAAEPQPVVGREPLVLSLTVDFEQEAAELSVQGRGEPIRLVLVDGEWRPANGDP